MFNALITLENNVPHTLNPTLNITNCVNKSKQDKTVFSEATVPF